MANDPDTTPGSDDVVEISTDGACLGNPGPGGWGAVLRYKGTEKEISGSAPDTTNNKMELQAAIEGLAALKRPSTVILYTDSSYVRNGIMKWVAGWQRNGWKTADKKPVKNQDLWVRLDELMAGHEIRFHWVRGHSEHPENERCDVLAVAARDAAAGR